MECSDHAALHHAPETFDGIGMNRTSDIFSDPMINGAVGKFSVDAVIAAPFIGGDQADLVGHHFAHKARQGIAAQVVDHSRNHPAFALDSADNNRLAEAASAASASSSTRTAALIGVTVLGLAANKGFVYFDIADELLEFDITE